MQINGYKHTSHTRTHTLTHTKMSTFFVPNLRFTQVFTMYKNTVSDDVLTVENISDKKLPKNYGSGTFMDIIRKSGVSKNIFCDLFYRARIGYDDQSKIWRFEILYSTLHSGRTLWNGKEFHSTFRTNRPQLLRGSYMSFDLATGRESIVHPFTHLSEFVNVMEYDDICGVDVNALTPRERLSFIFNLSLDEEIYDVGLSSFYYNQYVRNGLTYKGY